MNNIANASHLHLELSVPMPRELQVIAEQKHRTIEQLVLTAIREKISALAHDDYIRNRAERSNRAAFEEELAGVSEQEPEEWDRI
jgi:hypothetical protein